MTKKNPKNNPENQGNQNNRNQNKPRGRKKKENKQNSLKNQENNQENNQRNKPEEKENKNKLIVEFPRENGIIRLEVNTLNLIYLAELIDIYTEHFPEFYKPLMQKILQDLPNIVNTTEDSIQINNDLLSSPVPYTPGHMNCNPLTFEELKHLSMKLLHM